ncbi:MAG: phytanoyl-CoA dioxygenase family protein [Actinomycetota bacterium]
MADADPTPTAPTFQPDCLEEAARQWQTDGWAVIDGAVDSAKAATALAELRASARSGPGGSVRRADRRGRGPVDDPEDRSARFRDAQFDGTTLFPVEDCPTLNRLFVDPGLLRFAAAALGTDDLRIYQARVWSKRGGHVDYDQPTHRDGNHSIVPIANRPGWWHLECFVYLQDVDSTNGATGLVPGHVDRAGLGERAPAADRVAALRRAEVVAAGRAGTIMAYRSDIWHRGRNLSPDAERDILVVSFRPAEAEWISFDAFGPMVNRQDWISFAESSTPAELALFGVPPPGHRYWDRATVDALGALYPQLNVTPWRDALSD